MRYDARGRSQDDERLARPLDPRRYRQAMLSLDILRRAPKVLLHDHLDGGLRPSTIVELAQEIGYGGLPTRDPDDLGRWFHASAASGSPSPTVTVGSWASTSPARKRAIRPKRTARPSSTATCRTSPSPSTRARRSGRLRSGRRSSTAARIASATA